MRAIEMRRDRNGIILRSRSTTKQVMPALERLKRTGKTGGYRWQKAWTEMPPSALGYIWQAAPDGFALPIGVAPKPKLILTLLPAAMGRARQATVSKGERDRAVLAILNAYKLATGEEPTAKPAEAFIARVENCYHGLLPNGFGVSRSKATLQKLIMKSRSK